MSQSQDLQKDKDKLMHDTKNLETKQCQLISNAKLNAKYIPLIQINQRKMYLIHYRSMASSSVKESKGLAD